MLHKEEAGLTVDRSLDGAPADVQTFQVIIWLCCTDCCISFYSTACVTMLFEASSGNYLFLRFIIPIKFDCSIADLHVW